MECARIRDLWDGFYSRVARILPAIPSDLDLLRLDFEAVSAQQERLVVGHLGNIIQLQVSCGGGQRPVDGLRQQYVHTIRRSCGTL